MAFSSALQFLFLQTILLQSCTNLACAEIIELEDETGGFTSPNYPDNYPIGVTVEWRIRVPSAGGKIHLYFPDFSVDVFFDYVEVRDGPDPNSPILLIQDGLGASALISSGPSMYIRFHADEASQGDRGFRAVYAQVLDDVYRELIFKDVGTFSSPHHDALYPTGIDYSWVIKSNIENAPIQLKFSAFDVRLLDQVEIRDGGNLASPLLGEHNGANLPPVYYSTGGNMLVRLKSAPQGGSTSKGFKASFTNAPTSDAPMESTPPQPTTQIGPEPTTMPTVAPIETTAEQISTTKETVQPEPTSPAGDQQDTTPNSAKKLAAIMSLTIGFVSVSFSYLYS